MNTETQAPPTRLIPVSEWDKHHPWPTPGAMRFYIYNRHSNGFNEHGVVKRVGRRILIDETSFFRWVNAQPGNQTGGAA